GAIRTGPGPHGTTRVGMLRSTIFHGRLHRQVSQIDPSAHAIPSSLTVMLQQLVRAFGDVVSGRSPFQGRGRFLLAARRSMVWPFRYGAWRCRCRWGRAESAENTPPLTI